MNLSELIQKVNTAVVNVEKYFALGDNHYCFFSYYFEITNEDNFQVKIIYFKKDKPATKPTPKWEMQDIVYTKPKNAKSSDLDKWTHQGTTDTNLSNHLLGLFENHLEQLQEYIQGKTEFKKIFKNNYRQDKTSFLIKASYNTIAEAGMFIGSTLLANADSDLENKIKDVTSQRNTGNNNTMAVTSNILKSIELPKGTLTITNIELNNAFRISYQ